VSGIFEIGLAKYLPGLASNPDPPNLCWWHEPPVPGQLCLLFKKDFPYILLDIPPPSLPPSLPPFLFVPEFELARQALHHLSHAPNPLFHAHIQMHMHQKAFFLNYIIHIA
jgi:hypothetical protein